jgi:8-oxo-dGTP pyrophosphatase MutT (NUDIX family)
VRRETLEEAGIEVGEVIYHSSQPWPGNFLHHRSNEIINPIVLVQINCE